MGSAHTMQAEPLFFLACLALRRAPSFFSYKCGKPVVTRQYLAFAHLPSPLKKKKEIGPVDAVKCETWGTGEQKHMNSSDTTLQTNVTSKKKKKNSAFTMEETA